MVENDGIAADIPLRLKTDAGMDSPDRADLAGIIAGELTVGNIDPMAGLRTFGPVDMLVIAEKRHGFRCLAHLGIETVEADRQLAIQQGFQGLEGSTALRCYLHERQTFANGLDFIFIGISRRHVHDRPLPA